MVKKSRGFRSRTRRSFKLKEKYNITKYLQEFEIGDRVVIEPYSHSQSGLPHKRYRGKVGIIEGKRGKAYIIKVDGKIIITKPEHLKKL